MSKRLFIICGLGVVGLGAAVELPHMKRYQQTALVEKLDVLAMTQRADLVISGVVTKRLGTIREVDATGEDMVYTRWRISPTKLLKGKQQKSVVIRVLGGQYATTIVDAEDQPTFVEGEKVTVFLKQIPEWKNEYRVVGEFQGKFRLEERQDTTIAIQSETKDEQGLSALEESVQKQK